MDPSSSHPSEHSAQAAAADAAAAAAAAAAAHSASSDASAPSSSPLTLPTLPFALPSLPNIPSLSSMNFPFIPMAQQGENKGNSENPNNGENPNNNDGKVDDKNAMSAIPLGLPGMPQFAGFGQNAAAAAAAAAAAGLSFPMPFNPNGAAQLTPAQIQALQMNLNSLYPPNALLFDDSAARGTGGQTSGSASTGEGEEGEDGGNNSATKARKPYTVSKARETWTEEEHEKFLEALRLYDRDWKKICGHISTKSVIQIRSHAQKYFIKMGKMGLEKFVPPARPKKRSNRPYPRNETDGHSSHHRSSSSPNSAAIAAAAAQGNLASMMAQNFAAQLAASGLRFPGADGSFTLGEGGEKTGAPFAVEDVVSAFGLLAEASGSKKKRKRESAKKSKSVKEEKGKKGAASRKNKKGDDKGKSPSTTRKGRGKKVKSEDGEDSDELSDSSDSSDSSDADGDSDDEDKNKEPSAADILNSVTGLNGLSGLNSFQMQMAMAMNAFAPKNMMNAAAAAGLSFPIAPTTLAESAKSAKPGDSPTASSSSPSPSPNPSPNAQTLSPNIQATSPADQAALRNRLIAPLLPLPAKFPQSPLRTAATATTNPPALSASSAGASAAAAAAVAAAASAASNSFRVIPQSGPQGLQRSTSGEQK